MSFILGYVAEMPMLGFAVSSVVVLGLYLETINKTYKWMGDLVLRSFIYSFKPIEHAKRQDKWMVKTCVLACLSCGLYMTWAIATLNLSLYGFVTVLIVSCLAIDNLCKFRMVGIGFGGKNIECTYRLSDYLKQKVTQWNVLGNVT